MEEKHFSLCSEEFLSSFALEFIKYEVLIQVYIMGVKTYDRSKKDVMLFELACVTGLKGNINYAHTLCSKLRFVLLFKMRRLVRRCIMRGWRFDRALILEKPWLRLVELKVKLLPQAIALECSSSEAAKDTQSMKAMEFKVELVECARVAARNGNCIYSPQVAAVTSERYVIPKCTVLEVWRRICENAKRTISINAESNESSSDLFLKDLDWRVADLLLLYDLNFRVVTPKHLLRPQQVEILQDLFRMIVEKNVENLLRDKSEDVPRAWMQVYAMNAFSPENVSLVLLQRKWYELKLEARSQVLEYWLGKSTSVPHPLLISIVSTFRHIVLEPFPLWTDLVKSGLVVELKDISKNIYNEVIVDTQYHGPQTPSIENKHIEEGKGENDAAPVYVSNSDEEIELIGNGTLLEEKSESSNENSNTQTLIKADNNTKDIDEDKSLSILSKSNFMYTLKEFDSIIDLNTIDPTKAQISLIMDSDSEPEKETISTLTDQDKREGHLRDMLQEEDQLKTSDDQNVDAVDSDMETSILDCKLAMDTTIPLFRCDQTSAWKKYYKNKSINVRKLTKNKLFSKRGKQFESNDTRALEKLKSNKRYNYEALCTNPDFNFKLKRLSNKFLWKKRNQFLLAKCKPVTVDLVGIPLPCIKKPTVSRRAKKVELPDIHEIRKINSMILTAEVAPVSVHAPAANMDSQLDSALHSVTQLYEQMLTKHTANTNNEITNLNCDAGLDGLLEKLSAQAGASFNAPHDAISTHLEPGKQSRRDVARDSNQDDQRTDAMSESQRNYLEEQRLSSDIINIISRPPTTLKINHRKLDIFPSNNKNGKEKHRENIHECNNLKDRTLKRTNENTNDENWSDSDDDNIKLSVVVDDLKKNQAKEPKRDTKKKETKLLEQPKSRKKKKFKERTVSVPVEPKCFDDYEEWSRQRNITLKYFNLPNYRNNDPNGSAACPPVIKAFYKKSETAPLSHIANIRIAQKSKENASGADNVIKNLQPRGLSPGVNIHHLNIPAVQLDRNNPEVPIIDLTDTIDDHNADNVSCELGIITVPTTNYQTHEAANQLQIPSNVLEHNDTGSSLDTNGGTAEDFTPIITGVCSLANAELVDCTDVESYSAAVAKEPDNTKIIQPLMVPLPPLPSVPVLSNVTRGAERFPTAPAVPTNTMTVTSVQSLSNLQRNYAEPNSRKEGYAHIALPSTVSPQNRVFKILVPLPRVTPGTAVQNHLPKDPPRPLVNLETAQTKKNMYLVITPQSLQLSEKTTVSQNTEMQTNNPTTDQSWHTKSTTITINVSLWAEGKTEMELKILRVDAAKSIWRLQGGQLIVTQSDLTCEVPTYWSMGSDECKVRILFPEENKGRAIYNPTTVQVYEGAANGTTEFAKWVKSVLIPETNKDIATITPDCSIKESAEIQAEPTIQPPETQSHVDLQAADEVKLEVKETSEQAPSLRLKVKSFARLKDEGDENIAHDRVYFQGTLFQKVSDKPLKYAKVLTVVPTVEECCRLSAMDIPLFILPSKTEPVETIQPL